MPIQNIPSVLKHGILSNERSKKLTHFSVAMDEVQERRDGVKVPGGLRLHQYANVYLHARNPMMFRRRDVAHELCVLRVSTRALQIDGAVIADRNASSDYVRFLSVNQTNLLDLDAIYARDWRHPNDPIAFYRHRSQKCAELLVPHVLPPDFLEGAWVVGDTIGADLEKVGFALPITADSDLFFH